MNRVIDVCFFRNAFDRAPQSHPMDVDALEEAFRVAAADGLADVAADDDAKKASPAFSPCRYRPGTSRAKANVDTVTAFVMDLDNVDDVIVDTVFDVLASIGVRAFGWTTWGSGWKKRPQAWRIVVPFAVDVDASRWPSVWGALTERLSLGRNDVQTKNADRIHFVPGAPMMVPDGDGRRRNDAIRWRTLRGVLLDPSTVALAPVAPPPSPAPPPVVVRPVARQNDDVARVDLRPITSTVRDRVRDCDPVASALGLDPGKKPQQKRRWCCPSPACAGKTEPTLTTPKPTQTTGGWKCHRCGEKGDAFTLVGLAQGFRLPLQGRDFVDVLAWLASYAGVDIPEAPSRPSPLRTVIVPPAPKAPEPESLAPSAYRAAWEALEARQTDDSAAARWLDGRGIPARLTRSGFAALDRATASALAAGPAAGWLAHNAGSAIVAPIRSMQTAEVAALQGRVFVVTDPAFKRCTFGKLRDPDGAPRVFGDVSALAAARVVVLVEGLADTWAGEALTSGVDGVVVIGADSAGAIPLVAGRLKAPRVVVVRHLDRPDVVEEDKQGTGQKNAREALEALGRRGVAFQWPTFRRALFALGAATRSVPPGFDLAAALELARAADFADVQQAFLSAIGEAPPVKLPGLVVPPKPSPRRVSAAPPVPAPPAATPVVAPVVQAPPGDVIDAFKERPRARAALTDDGWSAGEVESLFQTIDRLWGPQ
jgi:hypothetical protein